MSSAGQIVIGIDQGTTNTKAVVVDRYGAMLARASRPIATFSAQPGWVEQDPDSMLANVIYCAREVLTASGRPLEEVVGLGLANHTETLVVWDARSGSAVMPAIVWQDRRGAAEIEALEPHALWIKERTGLDLDPTFTAAKLSWLFRNRSDIADGLRTGAYLFGTVDVWLIWKLTGGAVYATEPGNASRTMLFNIDRMLWHPELIELFSLELAQLPECRSSHATFGQTDRSFFGVPIPIIGVLGDQQASLFGHGCFDEMQMKVTYGTGAFLWINAGTRHRAAPGKGMVRTIAWQLDETCYAYEGFIMYAGKILDWLAGRLAVEGDAASVAAAAEAVRTSGGAILVPAFQGLASPWWQPDIRAALFGLSEATSIGHIAHAGLEAVCYQLRAILDVIGQTDTGGMPIIRADGGMTASRYLMQLQADILQRPLSLSSSDLVTAFGVALMAGIGAGLWDSTETLRSIIPETESIVPQAASAARWARSYAAWRRATELLIAQGSLDLDG